MATVQGPRIFGNSLSVGIAGKTPRSFVSYGRVISGGSDTGDSGTVARNAQFFTTEGRRMAVLFDSTAPESVEILTQPEVGRVIARSDGGISYDLNDIDYTYSGDQTFTYRRNNGGSRTDVTATVTVKHTERPAGWGNGDYYYMETDAKDAFVVQPSETARVLHVATDGLSEADILARHSGTKDQLDRSNVRPADIMEVAARDKAGIVISPTTYYGETEDLALTPLVAAKLYQYSLDDTLFRSWWVLYKRGQTFAQPAALSGVLSESQLHPTYVGTYGAGAKPVFNDLFQAATGMTTGVVFQDLHFTRTSMHRNTDFLIYDGCRADCTTYPAAASAVYPFGGGGVNQDGIMNRANTIRRTVVTDAHGSTPTKGKTHWARTNADRVSGIYQDDTYAPLFEKIYVDQAGWSQGYRSDQDGGFPKSPDDGSHGMYTQGDLYDVTARDIIVTNPSFNALQFRSGTVAQRLFMAFANAGLLFGNGEGIGDPNIPYGEEQQSLTNPPLLNGSEKKATNLSYGSDIIVTEAGEKDGWNAGKGDPTDGFPGGSGWRDHEPEPCHHGQAGDDHKWRAEGKADLVSNRDRPGGACQHSCPDLRRETCQSRCGRVLVSTSGILPLELVAVAWLELGCHRVEQRRPQCAQHRGVQRPVEIHHGIVPCGFRRQPPGRGRSVGADRGASGILPVANRAMAKAACRRKDRGLRALRRWVHSGFPLGRDRRLVHARSAGHIRRRQHRPWRLPGLLEHLSQAADQRSDHRCGWIALDAGR